MRKYCGSKIEHIGTWCAVVNRTEPKTLYVNAGCPEYRGMVRRPGCRVPHSGPDGLALASRHHIRITQLQARSFPDCAELGIWSSTFTERKCPPVPKSCLNLPCQGLPGLLTKLSEARARRRVPWLLHLPYLLSCSYDKISFSRHWPLQSLFAMPEEPRAMPVSQKKGWGLNVNFNPMNF